MLRDFQYDQQKGEYKGTVVRPGSGKKIAANIVCVDHDVTIHDPKCVIVVAQEGGESRAAIRMHTTQPALGRRIHHVEAEVGVRRFFLIY
jgi:hypothetical protein